MKFLINKGNFIAALFLFCAADAGATLYKFKGIVDVVNGRLYPYHYVEIKKDKIVSLREAPAATENALDYSQLYLSPGLIDSHSHVFVSQLITDGNFSNAIKRELPLSKGERSTRAKKYLKQYLAEGFTSLFDLGNSGNFFDVELRDEISRDPNFPALLVSGPGIAAFPGQFPPQSTRAQVENEYRIVDKNTDVTKLLAGYVKKKADILKIYLDNYPAPGTIDESVLSKILAHPLSKKFKKITFHSFIPESGALIKKFKIKNTEHFNFYLGKDLPGSLSFITPTNFDSQTLKQFNGYSPAYYLLQQNILKKLYQSKIKILFGPDFYLDDPKVPDFNRAQIVKRTMNSFIDAQFSAPEILKMMTYYPALSIGMEKQMGQISVGSKATLVGTRVNPLENSSALFDVSLVINKGKIIVSK